MNYVNIFVDDIQHKTHLKKLQLQKVELITQLNKGLEETQKLVEDKTSQISKLRYLLKKILTKLTLS